MENISNLLLEYRKENNLTQQELGDLIGVSYKTISKWETGKGFPDISLLEKISDVLNISIDDLLKGKNNKKKSKKLLFMISIIIILILIIFLKSNYNKNNIDNNKEQYKCVLEADYIIKLIEESNDKNYKYITISRFQTEGVYTIKISTTIANQLEVNKSFRFTFNTKEKYNDAPANIIFDNSEIINITKTPENEIGGMKYQCK